MDERKITEFESVFESAVRPKLQIAPIEWSRVLVALDGSERVSSAVAIGLNLAKRRAMPLRFIATRAPLEGEDEPALSAALDGWLADALAQAEAEGVEASGASQVGLPGETILAELRSAPTSLLIISTPHGGQTPDQTTLGSTVDYLLKASDCPMLLIKAPVAEPGAVFRRVLAYLPGGFEVGPHFSIPFGLVEPGGALELLHVVNEEEVHRYAAAFEVTVDGDSEESKAAAMVRGIEQRMTGLLEAARKEVRDEPFSCRSLVTHGDPIQRVALHLLNEKDTLLVVESESRPETPISPEAYVLLKEITGVPLLAL